jgi:hypothetical protein
MRRRRSWFETVQFLVVLGVLAGAVGGLAIGVVTNKAASSGSSSATH